MFWPDPEIFTETTEFVYDTLATRLRELAFLNPGLTIHLSDERDEREDTFHFEGGIVAFVEHLNAGRQALHAPADRHLVVARRGRGRRGASSGPPPTKRPCSPS